MDRSTDIDQARVDFWRADYESQPAYEEHGEPLPGSNLKHDDDVLWLDFFVCRVIWGTDDPTTFLGYSNDFGDYAVPLQAEYITDRAPLDPQETPMPIYPVQQQQQQRQATPAPKGGSAHDKKKALQAVLKLLKPEDAKRVRELVRSKKPELLEKE